MRREEASKNRRWIVLLAAVVAQRGYPTSKVHAQSPITMQLRRVLFASINNNHGASERSKHRCNGQQRGEARQATHNTRRHRFRYSNGCDWQTAKWRLFHPCVRYQATDNQQHGVTEQNVAQTVHTPWRGWRHHPLSLSASLASWSLSARSRKPVRA